MATGQARRLPRGYATLADQLRRALLSAYLGIAEATSRTGADRLARYRCARGCDSSFSSNSRRSLGGSGIPEQF